MVIAGPVSLSSQIGFYKGQKSSHPSGNILLVTFNASWKSHGVDLEAHWVAASFGCFPRLKGLIGLFVEVYIDAGAEGQNERIFDALLADA